MTLQLGSTGDLVSHWRHVMAAMFAGYARRIDPDTDTTIGPLDPGAVFGDRAAAWQREYERNTHQPVDGIVSDKDLADLKIVLPHRPIWIYSAPGSGADWWLGPSFDLGERCKHVLNLNHQPLAFQKGGYLGLLGGDPGFSYNEVTYDQYKSLEYNLDHNPDINNPDLEIWASGYSQSADGMEDAFEVLFGDGGFIHPGDPTQTPSPPGKYKHLRSRINGLVQFGNPSTKGTGIANKVRPPWLDALIHNVNYPNDFYAVAPDEIRRNFYAIIVEANMSLPFFVHVLKIAGPIILQTIPIFGGFLGPLAPVALAGVTGLNAFLPMLTGLMGQAQSSGDEEVDRKLIEMLSVTGLIRNVPGLIGLVAALPGLQAHGGYPFDQVMMERAYDVIASFRR